MQRLRERVSVPERSREPTGEFRLIRNGSVIQPEPVIPKMPPVPQFTEEANRALWQHRLFVFGREHILVKEPDPAPPGSRIPTQVEVKKAKSSGRPKFDRKSFPKWRDNHGRRRFGNDRLGYLD